MIIIGIGVTRGTTGEDILETGTILDTGMTACRGEANPTVIITGGRELPRHPGLLARLLDLTVRHPGLPSLGFGRRSREGDTGRPLKARPIDSPAGFP